MEFKGTKSEWELDGSPFWGQEENEYHGEWSVKAEEKIVANIHAYSFYNVTFDEAKANAQLISKAPEMLEMLKDIKDYLGSDKREQVEQLIKEATEI